MGEPGDVAALGCHDMLPNDMSSTDYTTFAQTTFAREKALIEKLGLAKPQCALAGRAQHPRRC
jgi:hypothetical protein